MDDKYKIAKEKLIKYDQQHLLMFYDEINEAEKEKILNQILNIDFEEIIELYKNSYKEEDYSNVKISPIEHIIRENIDKMHETYYKSIGERVIKNNEFAVATMAGGQGTRLGYKGPKGTYELELDPKKSLFEIQCENLKQAKEKYNVVIPWYIMTSEENNNATIKYFEEHNYFDYPRESIHFFIQSKLPIIDTNGKLILSEPYLIKEAANGNGNIFNSMKKDKVIQDLEQKNIKWIFIGGIDNVLLKTVDPLFIGMTVSKKLDIASKSIFKEDEEKQEYVFCKVNDKPSIFDCESINPDYNNAKDELGNYLYKYINIVSHLFSIDAIKILQDIKLPYHRAYKKNAFVNEEGMKQVPDKPNTFKFENFIFDGFKYFDNMLLLRVKEEDEFAPIKNFTGKYNPDTAKEKYLKKINKKQ